MAAGDVDSRNVDNLGGRKVIYGTIDVDTTPRLFAIADTANAILYGTIHSQTTGVGVSMIINSSDGTAGNAMGTIWVDGGGAAKADYMLVMANG